MSVASDNNNHHQTQASSSLLTSTRYYQLDTRDDDDRNNTNTSNSADRQIEMFPCGNNRNDMHDSENLGINGSNGNSSSANGNGSKAPKIQAGLGKFASDNLLTVPLRTDDESQCISGALYRFTPHFNHHALILYASRDSSMMRKVITKKALLVVTDQSRADWWFVHHQGVSGWISMSRDMLDSQVITRARTCKRYEDWQGRNYFVCGGKGVLGGDAKFFL
jgi:hypothetical protein